MKKKTITSFIIILFRFFRNASTSVLHELLENSSARSQRCDFEILRPRDSRSHWIKRRHHGYGILHDAQSFDLRTENIQLFLHCCFHTRVFHEALGTWNSSLSQRQVSLFNISFFVISAAFGN